MAVWSEVNLRECGKDIRMDAEYYQPFFLKLIKHWREQSIGPLGNNYARIMKRRFLPECGKRFDYIEIGRVSTILGTYDVINLDDTEAPSRAQYVVKPGDVILSEVRPNRSAVSLIPEGIGRTVCSSGFGVLKAEIISPEYLFAYFKTSIITKLLDRETTATMYPAVSDKDVLSLPFPEPRENVAKKVTAAVKKVFGKMAESKELYSKAEMLLLEKLGLKDLNLSPSLYYERQYSETVKAGRFDAEYFMPIKRQILDRLSKLAKEPVSSYFRPVRSLFVPSKYTSDMLVRNYDLTDAMTPFLDDSVEPMETGEIGSIKKLLKINDIVVSRLRSYLKEIAIVCPAKGPEQVGSTEFIVLRGLRKDVSPEGLLVYLRTPWVQTVLKWCQDGSNHPRFQEKEILSLPCPEIITETQGDLAMLVRQSFNAYGESRQLLKEAIHMVEDAVLKGTE